MKGLGSGVKEFKKAAKDDTVAANIFEAELTLWYSSAALMMVNENHNKIAKTKI